MSCGDKILVLPSAQRNFSLPPRITPHRGSTSAARPDEGQTGPGSTPSPGSASRRGACCHGQEVAGLRAWHSSGAKRPSGLQMEDAKHTKNVADS